MPVAACREAEAVLIREALGIRKRRNLTEDGRAQLKAATSRRESANPASNSRTLIFTLPERAGRVRGRNRKGKER
jgi:hypothetical protein